MKIKRLLSGIILAFVFLAFSGCAIYGVDAFFSNNPKSLGSVYNATADGVVIDSEAREENSEQVMEEKLEEPETNIFGISAKSVISVESDLSDIDKIVFEKNSEKKLPIASLTKLMTAVVAMENLDLIQAIVVSEKAGSQDTMKLDLKTGDTFSVTELLYISLIRSSNKAAYALSEQIGEQEFVNLMNKKATEVGLENTIFKDPTGLSFENVSTAKDLAKFTKYLLKNYPEIINITKTKKLSFPNLGEIENTNELLGEIPDIIGGKTGFTREANGCMLLIIKSPISGIYSINIVLGAEDRFLEMRKLINFVNL